MLIGALVAATVGFVRVRAWARELASAPGDRADRAHQLRRARLAALFGCDIGAVALFVTAEAIKGHRHTAPRTAAGFLAILALMLFVYGIVLAAGALRPPTSSFVASIAGPRTGGGSSSPWWSSG